MSVFRTETVHCPACETPVEFELVVSVNADRRPDLRQAILDGTFQRQTCPSCGTGFRVEPSFTYMNLGRDQYIGVWPIDMRAEWQANAERTRATFEAALGSGATPEARKLGAKLEPRVVFGWPALVEKILARQAGIDDRTLELAKVAVLRHGAETYVPGKRELRLVGVGETNLMLAWVNTADTTIAGTVSVPRKLIGEIEAEPDAWKALRDDVADGLVVDFQREMLSA